MNDAEIIAWHKAKAEKLTEEGNRAIAAGQDKLADAKAHTEMALRLELTEPEPINVLPRFYASEKTASAPNGVTIEKLRSYLAHNGGRVAHVAQHFDVSEETIQKLLDSENSGIRVAPRGWLKVMDPIKTENFLNQSR